MVGSAMPPSPTPFAIDSCNAFIASRSPASRCAIPNAKPKAKSARRPNPAHRLRPELISNAMHARPVWHCNHTAAAPPWVIDILCAGSSRHTSTIHKARGVYALTFIQLGTIQALRSPAYFDRSPSPKSAVTFNRNHRSRVSEISGHVRRNTQSGPRSSAQSKPAPPTE